MNKRVVITGVGLVTPIGIGKDAFWDSLKNGRSGVGKITLFDASDYASHIASEVKGWVADQHIDRKKAKRMDRFAQMSIAASRSFVRSSSWMRPKSRMPPPRCENRKWSALNSSN